MDYLEATLISHMLLVTDSRSVPMKWTLQKLDWLPIGCSENDLIKNSSFKYVVKSMRKMVDLFSSFIFSSEVIKGLLNVIRRVSVTSPVLMISSSAD